MKIVTSQAFQGDVMFRKRTEALPSNALKRPDAGEIVVAHSETGHHHVAQGPDISIFAFGHDPLRSILRVPTKADVVHRRDFDTHEALQLDAGDWDVVRQREYVGEEITRPVGD